MAFVAESAVVLQVALAYMSHIIVPSYFVSAPLPVTNQPANARHFFYAMNTFKMIWNFCTSYGFPAFLPLGVRLETKGGRAVNVLRLRVMFLSKGSLEQEHLLG